MDSLRQHNSKRDDAPERGEIVTGTNGTDWDKWDKCPKGQGEWDWDKRDTLLRSVPTVPPTSAPF